jgi:hypothetical protein
MVKDSFNNKLYTTISVLGLSLLVLGATSYEIKSFAQIDCQSEPFECDAPISDLAYDIAEVHVEQAKLEMAKVPPNIEGAELHDNLAGMSVQEISKMGDVGSAPLSPENLQKLNEAGIENCFINSNATVICFT